MVVLMDVCKIEPPGTVALKKSSEEGLRPPLAPSEKNNAVPVSRKPRTREVTSRYKSGITHIAIPPRSTIVGSQRCLSPTVGRTPLSPTPPLPKRSQSAEKRRPSTPTSRASAPSSPLKKLDALSSPSLRPLTPVHDIAAEMQLSSRRLGGGRAPDGLWPSMRNLSASFLSESASVSLGKRNKPIVNSNVTSVHKSKSASNEALAGKRTPPKGKNISDQLENSKFLADRHRWPGIMNGKLSPKAMSRSMDLTGRASGVPGSPGSQRGVSPTRRAYISDGPSRVYQKTVNEMTRRMSFDGSGRLERETSASAKVLERTPSWSHPSRTLSLPGSPHPSSPSTTALPSSSSSRSMASPSHTRPITPPSSATSSGRIGISSSVLSYFVNLRKGKKSASHIEDAHQLRLLNNRYLQWRFVNARARAAMSIQKIKAEKILHGVWVATSGLHDSVILKSINMQQFRRVLKLSLILKDQMQYLEDWALLEKEQCSSLSGVVEALQASTLKLPVTEGARTDAHALKDVTSSAVDVMQAMGSFIYQLLPMVERANSVASELAEVAALERVMLDECRELLALAAAMQVQESSYSANLLQLRQEEIRLKPPSSTTRMRSG